MLFSKIGLINEQFDYQKDMYVGIEGKYIDYIGTERPEKDYGEEYDGRKKLLLPGFCNAHSHSPMTLLRGYGENLSLQDWLNKRIFPFEGKMTAEDMYDGAMLAIAEMLRFGTVSFTDMYYCGEQVSKAVLESGIKCNFSLGTLCFDDRSLYELPIYKEAAYLIENYQNAHDGDLKIDLCIHGEYTSTPKVVAQMADFAGETNARLHIHLSETKQEHEACKARHGMTPMRYFDSLGLLEHPVTAAHCVWLEDEDYTLVKGKDFTISCCPVSNMKLAGGFANVPKILESGINFALGTDGCASNNNLNLMQDAYVFSLIYKGYFKDPAVVTPQQVLQMMTVNGASSQGREKTGIVKEKYFADLTVFDMDQPYMTPVHDMLSNLIYSAQGNDIVMTIVNGKVLYNQGTYTTIDIERVKYHAQKAAERILNRLGGSV